ncbi:hypothetical protein QR680_014201 [Steinernema hermaphroditum]|uniref:CHK kinase-like domain-containing protein n=1 Tax=Steinernema hermaphroditum TaxID=289476 RepID=A0AA39I815_9BILA|nr:hypothetical protein QR680_014201 [Steinernema hermaphroditum]
MAVKVDSGAGVLPVLNDFDGEKRIADTPFTAKWLLDILMQKDDVFVGRSKGAPVSDVHGKDISGGKGFVSRVYKVTIEFEDKKSPHDVILKVPGVESFGELFDGEENPAKVASVAESHNREVYFYNNFAPKLDVPFVKVFAAIEWIPGKQLGCILMESLLGRSTTQSVHEGLTKKQLQATILQLAKLHSSFLLMPEKEWKGKFANKTFKSETCIEFLVSFMKKLSACRPDVFKEGIQTLLPYASSSKFNSYATAEVGVELGIPPVLIHGDMWTNNLMFHLNADGSVSDEIDAVLDWQIINDGCVTFDLARLLVISLDGDVRRRLEPEILAFYYENLKKLLAEGGKDIDFTLEQVASAYKINMANQAFHMLACVLIFGKMEGDTAEEKALCVARLEKMILRGKAAMEDCLEVLKTLSKEKSF